MDDMEMPEACARELTELAQAGMPVEVGGFILLDWEIMTVKNTSKTPSRNFAMDDETLLDMMLYHKPELVGIFHSHPSLRNHPSEPDIVTMTLYPWLRHWIVTCTNVYEWRMAHDGPRPVRRDGSTGAEGMAYPVLTPPATLRRQSGRTAA